MHLLSKSPLSRQLAGDLILNAESQLKTLRAQGLKLDHIEILLINTKKAFESRKLTETISNLNELGSKLNEIKKNSTEFSKRALDVHKRIALATEMGMDVSQFKELLEDAHNLFDSEQFTEAIDTVNDCRQKLVDAQFLFITDKIKDIYDQLKELPKNVLNLQDVQKRFNDADAAIKDNDFALAWIITKQLSEICNELIAPFIKNVKEHAKDKIIEFQNDIENAKQMGVDISDAKEIFIEMVDRVKKANRFSEYKQIVDYTTAGKHALERAVRRKERVEGQRLSVLERLEPLIADFEDMKEQCAIPSSVEDLIKNAKDLFDKNKFEPALEDLERCKQKMEKLRRGSEPKIELKFISESLRSNLWNRTKLEVSNKGLATANNVVIRFSGPIETRRIPIIERLNYNSTEILEFGLKPEGAGSLPIDVDVDFLRSWDGKVYHEHQEIWLDVMFPNQPTVAPTPIPDYIPQPTPIPAGSQKDIETGTCLFCQNNIAKSELIFRCQCKAIYHLKCITDLDICVKCGSNLKEKMQKF